MSSSIHACSLARWPSDGRQGVTRSLSPVIPAQAGIQLEPAPSVAAVARSRSPYQRAWARFRRNRLGFFSLWVFVAMVAVAIIAEVVSNDRPLVVQFDGKWYFPIL